MMRVFLGQWAGFCYGVRRAVAMALKGARRYGRVFTLGPLIHNNQAVEELRRNGVEVIEDFESLPEDGVVLLRTHGVERSVREELRRRGIKVLDATCPRVARIHGIIRGAAKRGHRVVIFGDPDHPEVVALRSEAEKVDVVAHPDDVNRLDATDEPVCLVAQTTQDKFMFDKVVERMRRRFKKLSVHHTICDSTRSRQDELRAMLPCVDAVVVVGGKHSANTRRLAEIARTSGKPVHHIETAAQLPKTIEAGTVFVTAGASTPNWVIQDVMLRLGGGAETVWQRMVSLLVRWNITAAMAAAALTFAASNILKTPISYLPAIAALYVFCVHTFNQIIALRLEPLTKGAPFERLRLLLAFAAGAAALCLAFHAGLWRFLLLLLALGGGLLYGVDFIPTPGKLRSLRDLPGSKDIFCALGWTGVCALLPAVQSDASLPLLATTLAFVFLPVYIRSILFDVRQIERDRFLGREASPVALGERPTVFVLLVSAVLWMVVVGVLIETGGLGWEAVWLWGLAMVFVLLVLMRGRLRRFGGVLFEAVTDTGLAAVCLPFLWR